jgi:two-component system, sensor histidine kinase and response regulator
MERFKDVELRRGESLAAGTIQNLRARDPNCDQEILAKTRVIYEQQRQQIFRRTDRMFAVLMILQWIGGIVAACLLSPRTWEGSQSEIHPHVWLAVVLGGALAAMPVFLAWRFPGRTVTRHVIAVTQMLFSSLFIHISGGRIETHFHVFGSLAFLAFYRDWPVLIPATILVAADHYFRGVYWPQSVFGISTTSPYRWIEHAAWVLFEDVFLFIACREGVRDLWSNATDTAVMERMNADFRERTIELEQAYESKKAVVETALDAVISMDIEGRIIGWNSQAERTFGWTAQEALNRPLSETIIPARFRESHINGLRTFRETGLGPAINKRIELPAVNKRGEEFTVELAIAPIGAGETTTFCAFVRDITSRLRDAEALRSAKDAAEAANHAKSAFLAHMSHEIRTPLNGILGFADVLLKLGPEASEAERREYLETINHSGRHLLDLISDVLDVSKIESGQMEVEKVRCAPHEVIAQAISILRVRAQEKGISLEYTWKGPVPETIATDPSRFRQLLMNLIGNAIKFTEQGGVEVVAKLQAEANPSQIAIDVVDTGIGLAPESMERIFEPFIQADQSITRRFGGTGLGLTISRQIAELLGGELSVRSELGRGSTFRATVATGSLADVRLLEGPFADLAASTSVKKHDPMRPLPPAPILLVEDGATNRKLISLILRRAGANVTTAENGQIGLDLAAKHTFDLILMDMQMPVMDGYMAATQLRRRGVTTPIIALTAHSLKGDEERCREAGCSGYLSKPIDSDRLLRIVGDALRCRQPTIAEPVDSPIDDERPLNSTLPMHDPDFREIAEDFVERFRVQLDEMRRAAGDEDLSSLKQIAHWLKGSAGTAGFSALTPPALELERAANEADLARVGAALDALTTLSKRIVVHDPADAGSAEPAAV